MALLHHRLDALYDERKGTGKNHAANPCSAEETSDKLAALVDNSGKPVILLKIYKTPPSPASVPIFHENEEIAGNVELNFSKPESVEEVVLSLRGTMKGFAGHSKAFVEVTEQLWDAHRVELDVSSRATSNETSHVQLKGYFNWPFSLKLPRHVSSRNLSDGLVDSRCAGQLPPSFSLSNSHLNISYEVNVSVRGRHNLSLSSPFQYVPTMRPPHLASSAGTAYNRAVDEDQWEIFRSFSVRGIAFATYSVDVVCTFALPRPLYYTRGASIICALAIECTDENVLELLGNSRAPFVRLTRHVEDVGSGLESRIAKIWDAIRHPNAFVSSATWSVADTGNEEDQEMNAAVRALQTSLSGNMRSKMLIGQICLASDLTPSFSFAKMSIEYEIQVLPFRAAGFVAEDGERAILFRTGIKIASAPPMLTTMRPGSTASLPTVSRANLISGQQPNENLESPQWATSTSPAALPSSRCAGDLSDATRCVMHCNRGRDRPLPPLPKYPTTTKPNSGSNSGLNCGSLCAQPPEQGSSLRGGIPSKEADSESSLAISSLRRSATAPETRGRGLPQLPRAPFPSRQSTR